MATDYSRLRAIPLFSALDDDDLVWLGSLLKQISYPAGQVIFRQGESGQVLFIIAAGQVRIVHQDTAGATGTLRLLGQGQFFGEASLLRDEPRNATVTSNAPTTLFYLEKDGFDAMLARLPALRKQLEETAGRRTKTIGLRRFDWQDSDEIILWVAQRNVIPLIFESLGGLIFWHAIAAALVTLSFVALPRVGYLPGGWQWGLRIAAFLIVSLVWVWYIVDWLNDYLVLTNRRVIHIERYGILRDTRKEIPIQAVQNVDLARSWPTALLGLADITVKTIGGTLTFTHLADAEALQSRILDQRTLAEQATRRDDREEIRQTLLKGLKRESLAEPPPLKPPPDAYAALPSVAPRKPARALRQEQWSNLRQMRVVKGDEITWRKHWVVLVGHLIGPIIAGVLGLLLPLLMVVLPHAFTQFALVSSSALIITVVVMLAAIVWGLWEFLVWGGDIYILTANRIVDIERLPLGLREKRRESGLASIQNIDVNIPNIMARALDMGDVQVKTSAAGSDLTFFSVSDPYGVQRDIYHQLAKLRRAEERRRRQQMMEEINSWLQVYNELTTKTAG